MVEVHIWRTLAGVVALTPDEFGFSFCVQQADIEKLRADLETGMPMAQAVGFSGSSCHFDNLVRVESKEGSPTIVVVAREFLGRAKEDFTFRRQADREAFYETLLSFLGRQWKCEQTSRSSCILMLFPIAGVVFGILNLLCGGILLSAPPNPKPGVEPIPDGVTWGIMGFGLLLIPACIAGFIWARKIGQTKWETISER